MPDFGPSKRILDATERLEALEKTLREDLKRVDRIGMVALVLSGYQL